MIVSGIIAVGFFIGGVTLAVYAQNWRDLEDETPDILVDSVQEIGDATATASVSWSLYVCSLERKG